MAGICDGTKKPAWRIATPLQPSVLLLAQLESSREVAKRAI
jgi:hypothetical protein